MKRIAIVLKKSCIVGNVIVVDDSWIAPTSEEALYIENGWACPGDWWEAPEQRFYRAIPNNDDVEVTDGE